MGRIITTILLVLLLSGCTVGRGIIFGPTDKCYLVEIEKNGEIKVMGGPVNVDIKGPAKYKSTGKDCVDLGTIR